ncbi:15938_t:CDS:2, partial [Gigaspora rosea]
VAYSKRLEKYLNECKIQNFCHSEFSDHKIIGQGGFAVVYSTIFRGKKYALKSLNNNIILDNKAFKQIKNEIKSLYNKNINHPNIIKLHGFSREYADLYKRCWSSDPDQRPVLNEILIELERLSNLSINFMINYIDIDDQSLSKDFGFSNDTNTSLKSNSIEDPKERIDAKTDSDIHSSNRENRNSQKIHNQNHQILIKKLMNFYMPVYVKGSRRTYPVNKFFQFKSVVAKYAKKHKILGYNDRIILSKAQSKLWTMLSEEQKKVFKKLYEKTLKFHNSESGLNTNFMKTSQIKWKKLKKKKSPKKPNQNLLVTNTVSVPSSPCGVISDYEAKPNLPSSNAAISNSQDSPKLQLNLPSPCSVVSNSQDSPLPRADFDVSPDFLHHFTSPVPVFYNSEVQIPFLSEDTTFSSPEMSIFPWSSEYTTSISPNFSDPMYTPENITDESSPNSPNSKWPILSEENEDKFQMDTPPESIIDENYIEDDYYFS